MLPSHQSNPSVFLFAIATMVFSMATASANRLVVIDPGHGGSQPGAQKQGVQEKHLNLDLAKRLAFELRKRSIPSVLTRKTDKTLSLEKRVQIAGHYPRAIFVSLHYNASKNASAKGIETFYFTGLGSRRLASEIQRSLVWKTGAPARGAKLARYYVLRQNTLSEAVLVEGGFLTNHHERHIIRQPRFRQLQASAIADAIAFYQKSSQRRFQVPRRPKMVEVRPQTYRLRTWPVLASSETAPPAFNPYRNPSPFRQPRLVRLAQRHPYQR